MVYLLSLLGYYYYYYFHYFDHYYYYHILVPISNKCLLLITISILLLLLLQVCIFFSGLYYTFAKKEYSIQNIVYATYYIVFLEKVYKKERPFFVIMTGKKYTHLYIIIF